MSLNVSTGGLFANRYNATINANNFDVLVGDNFYNTDNATISANDISVSANSFINSHPRGDGNISADTFALSVAGDFDYTNNYLTNGNINATALNFQVGGDFSYDDANNNFVWDAQNSLVVLGSASITANNFINSGEITANTLSLSVAGDFDYATEYLGNGNINATNLNLQVGGNFSYNDTNNNFVWNENNSLVVLGSASVTADDFSNKGRIDVASS